MREMKRTDRQVKDPAEIDALINRCRVCRLGLFDGEEPYVIPLSFGYEAGAVYFHGARVGRKMDIIAAHPRVCIEFDRDLEMVDGGDVACRWSQKYESVIAWGRGEILTGTEEKREAFNIIMAHYTSRKEWTYEAPLIDRTAIIKVTLDRITAKQFL